MKSLILMLILAFSAPNSWAQENGAKALLKDAKEAKMELDIMYRFASYEFRRKWGEKIYEDVVFGVDSEGRCPFCGKPLKEKK